MDIKLKNNKRISRLAAAVVIILCAGLFFSWYGEFARRANVFYEDVEQDDAFLERLFWANYVLYRDIAEQTDGKKYTYEELYLDISEELVQENLTVDEIPVLDMSSAAFQNEFRQYFSESFSSKRSEILYDIAQNMDYCVIDNQTGKMIKNTGREIELLAQDKEKKKELPYVYYVMGTYDEAGNFVRAAVKGKNADELLKRVNRTMLGNLNESYNRWEWQSDGNGNYYTYEASYGALPYEESPYDAEIYEVPDENGGHEGRYENRIKKITVNIGAPKNTTFIYALTAEQKEQLSEGFLGDMNWNQYYAYVQSDVMESFAAVLAVLTIVILLLMQCRWYCLYRGKAERIAPEIAVTAGILLAVFSVECSIYLVHATNKGYFDNLWAEYLTSLPPEVYPALTATVNILILSLAFGLWVLCLNALGGIKILGVKEYLKQKSIVVRLCSMIYRKSAKLWRSFKNELLHVDLGKKTEKTVRKVVIANALLLGLMCSLWIFGWITIVIYSVILYFALKKYIRKLQEQYRRLLQATGSIAEGNLHTEFQEDLGIFESYKEELYKIQEGFRKAVDEEVKSQKMKTELITNVSHDLKTPLTAITTYIDLLKEENITDEQRREYMKVLENKSLRLKTLIEDLFEVSKANSKNVTIHPVDVDICNLMRQVYLEHEDRVEEANLIFRFKMPEERILLKLDSQKTYRIFENLYTNIIKYAMSGTRVYINAEYEYEDAQAGQKDNGQTQKKRKSLRIELKNMSARELEVDPEELTERFVRGDSSRNTEGSGLGLAIAKSFTELQGGRMEVTVDGDLFKVTLWLPV